MNKVVVILKGGIGNQLFCYAAARRLALVNNAELVIDDVSGFVRDLTYRRKYSLDQFHITARKATSRERFEPFGRYRRKLASLLSARKAFHERTYVAQEGLDFDSRLLTLAGGDTVHLDGLWQSEGYFKDVEDVIRQDLRISAPSDSANRGMVERIRSVNAVCVHIRWFEELSPSGTASFNLQPDYYLSAVQRIVTEVKDPHFFVFSDRPDSVGQVLPVSKNMITLVNHNYGDENAYADLWLMSQCHHFIIANSTFSWWGAWLGASEQSIVISPAFKSYAGTCGWGFDGLIPSRWIVI